MDSSTVYDGLIAIASISTWPEQKIRGPAPIACEYGPWAGGASGEEKTVFMRAFKGT
jgi:hypothetical protein